MDFDLCVFFDNEHISASQLLGVDQEFHSRVVSMRRATMNAKKVKRQAQQKAYLERKRARLTQWLIVED